MQSEEALALMISDTDNSTSGGSSSETIVTYTFDLHRLKVDTDDDSNKRYTLYFDTYDQTVVDTGNKLIIVDNVLSVDTNYNRIVYDSKIRQFIGYSMGGIVVSG